MSRGFVKEDDQEEAPFIPPRAALPDGVINYVTERGLKELHAERNELESERTKVKGNEDERRRARAVVDGRLALLNERIVTARIVEGTEGAVDEVRFGNTVTFSYVAGPQRGTERSFTLVGVDEANVKEGRIAFTAPIARALIGSRVGATIEFHLGAEIQQLRIISIS